MTKIGFTGSRRGMSDKQRHTLSKLIREAKDSITEFHHGDCVGADRQAHDTVRRICSNVKIVVHPPTIDTFRAHTIGSEYRKPLPYLCRNREILNESDLLIAAPFTDIEQQQSGTWYTVRHAKQKKKRTIILLRRGGYRELREK